MIHSLTKLAFAKHLITGEKLYWCKLQNTRKEIYYAVLPESLGVSRMCFTGGNPGMIYPSIFMGNPRGVRLIDNSIILECVEWNTIFSEPHPEIDSTLDR